MLNEQLIKLPTKIYLLEETISTNKYLETKTVFLVNSLKGSKITLKLKKFHYTLTNIIKFKSERIIKMRRKNPVIQTNIVALTILRKTMRTLMHPKMRNLILRNLNRFMMAGVCTKRSKSIFLQSVDTRH